MEANVIKTSRGANRPPRPLEVHQRSSGLLSDDDIRVVVEPLQLGQDRQSRGRQVQGLGPGLALRQTRDAALEIDPCPVQPQHFAETRAGEHEQLYRGERVWRSGVGVKRVA